MAKVVLKENEVLDDALRRFKRQVRRNGTLAEARKREYYVKPGVRRKLKSEAARKARKKQLMKPQKCGFIYAMNDKHLKNSKIYCINH